MSLCQCLGIAECVCVILFLGWGQFQNDKQNMNINPSIPNGIWAGKLMIILSYILCLFILYLQDPFYQHKLTGYAHLVTIWIQNF